VPSKAVYDAVGELALSLLIAHMFWPGLMRRHWIHFSDPLAVAIALLIELSAIVGALHALGQLLT
jgi:hypothetical protein